MKNLLMVLCIGVLMGFNSAVMSAENASEKCRLETVCDVDSNGYWGCKLKLICDD